MQEHYQSIVYLSISLSILYQVILHHRAYCTYTSISISTL